MKTNGKTMAALDEITRNPEQPRTYFAADELERLGASLKRRQQQPLTVIAHRDPKRPKIKYMINDGERRFRAAQKSGIKELWIVLDPDLLKLMDPPTPREDRLPIKHGYALTKFEREKQKKLWEKYKSKPVSEAFHHIRTQQPANGSRRVGDDARYITRRAAMASGICRSIASLPPSMVAGLTPEQRTTVAEQLRVLSRQAGDTAELIMPAGHDDEE